MPASNLLPTELYELTDEDRRRFAEEENRGMVSPRNPILNQAARMVAPGEVSSDRIQSVIARLLETAGSQQKNDVKDEKRRMLVGLAAPQIGEPLRIVVIDTVITPDRKNPGKLECFINPEIIWHSRETEEGREGCFSAGPVWGLVRRPIAVKLRAYTADGTLVERIFEDFTARIAQHELDHLDGIRFPERITLDKKRHWVHTEELLQYPKLIKNWGRICTRERWEAFKSAQVTPTQ